MLWNQVPFSAFSPRIFQHWSFFLIGLMIIFVGQREPWQCELPPPTPASVVEGQMMDGEDVDEVADSPVLSFEQVLAGSSSKATSVPLTPLAQNTGSSDGQTCVAMCINTLTGKNLSDSEVDRKYGFELLWALKNETGSAGYDWKDGGEIKRSAWDLIEYKVMTEKTPVLVALNGPEFSPGGRGHIVVVVDVRGEKVMFADPATGTVRETTRQTMNAAPQHPDGNFIFYALKRLEP